MNEVLVIPAATWLALLSNNHEQAGVLKKSFATEESRWHEKSLAFWMNGRDPMLRALLNVQAWRICPSYSLSIVTAYFMTQWPRYMNRISHLNMVEREVLPRLRIMIQCAGNSFSSSLLILLTQIWADNHCKAMSASWCKVSTC